MTRWRARSVAVGMGTETLSGSAPSAAEGTAAGALQKYLDDLDLSRLETDRRVYDFEAYQD